MVVVVRKGAVEGLGGTRWSGCGDRIQTSCWIGRGWSDRTGILFNWRDFPGVESVFGAVTPGVVSGVMRDGGREGALAH